jgi:hypothetical protein
MRPRRAKAGERRQGGHDFRGSGGEEFRVNGLDGRHRPLRQPDALVRSLAGRVPGQRQPRRGLSARLTRTASAALAGRSAATLAGRSA